MTDMANKWVTAWHPGRSGREDGRCDGKWASRTEMEIFVVTEQLHALTAVVVT